ncbi:MAG: DUF1772 domain-containing protein [Oceanospirillaceae bacterium]|nr:DUF1772 domain-containing protein [Oceanospirillaceae bacterium]
MYEFSVFLIIVGMGAIFGVALTASIVVHPILLAVSKPTAIEVFKPFFDKTHIIVIVLSMLVSGIALVASFLSGHWSWFIISLLMHLNGPYTLIFMMPLNRRLMAEDVDPHSEQTSNDLIKWGKLHAVRTVVNGLIFLIFIYDSTYLSN